MSAERARRALVATATVGCVGALLLSGPPTLATSHAGAKVRAHGVLQDLSPTTSDPTDGATARVTANPQDDGSTTVVLHVQGLQRLEDRPTLGAHVHVGPCVAGDGPAAGPHWRIGPAAPVSDRTEVWLDITLTGGGTGTAVAHVPFQVPVGSARSVVVHQLPTKSDGTAGSRLACLGVPF